MSGNGVTVQFHDGTWTTFHGGDLWDTDITSDSIRVWDAERRMIANVTMSHVTKIEFVARTRDRMAASNLATTLGIDPEALDAQLHIRGLMLVDEARHFGLVGTELDHAKHMLQCNEMSWQAIEAIAGELLDD